MSLNIKNERTHRLVVKLAKVTGETMTEAVTKAVEERLERVQTNHARNGNDRERLAAELVAIGKEIAVRLKEPYKSMDHADLLYDENGLPK
jgi:antitoxin VapB